MSLPLLTIAIPTLNRVDLLKGTVIELLNQIIPFKDQIEFLILNNASEDGTGAWLQEMFADHEVVKYHNYNERVGIVESISRCITTARGEYIWIFGDDDLPMPFAVDTLINLLRSSYDENYSIILLNCLIAEVKMNKYLKVYNSKLNVSPREMSIDDMIEEFHILLGLIIVLLFRRANWIQGKYFYNQDHHGYGFLAPLFAGSVNTKCLYYPFPVAIQRLGVQGYVNKWPIFILVGLPKLLDDTRKASLIKSNPLLSWQKSNSLIDIIKVLVVAKAFNYKRDHFVWTEAVKYQIGLKKIIIPVFQHLLPSWLAKVIFNAGANIKGSSE